MKKIFLSTILLAALAGSGCKKFIDINQDPNRPADVPEKLLLGPIELTIANNLVAGADGTVPSLYNHWLQIIALNQAIPNFGTYQFTSSDMNGTWSTVYTNILQNLKIMVDKAQSTGSSNYTAIGKILTAFTLGIATDTWGDIPYSEALKGTAVLNPKYDKQEDIYKAMQTLLDDAIADINKNVVLKPGTDDFFYYSSTLKTSDMAKWKRLAYTLKARYYMHLTKAPGTTATAQADLALTALTNGMTANSDDLKFPFVGSAGFESRWNLLMKPATTLILAKTIIDTLVDRADPRLPFIAALSASNPAYRGRQIGLVVAQQPLLGSFSLLGNFYGAAGSPGYVFNYTEALFLKAEATLIKSGFAAAQPIYIDGIKASMTKMGVSATDQDTYLKSYRGTLTAANALQRIMEEKEIGNFLLSESYTDYRRTGFPTLAAVPNAVSAPPRRFVYPQSELNTNPQPQHTAKATDRLWWDTQ